MRHFITIFIFSLTFLNASNVLNHNIYENDSNVDIVLSLDAPFDGKVIQKKDSSGIILSFSNLKTDESIEKNIDSPVIQKIIIQMINSNETTISLKSEQVFNIYVSKINDGFGLRIRTSILSAPIGIEDIASKIPQTSKKESMFFEIMYFCIALVSLMLLFLMIIWRRKIFFLQNQKPIIKAKDSWFFGNMNDNPDINILFKKYLDDSNYVLLFEFNDSKYLVLLGKSNILLEKYKKNENSNIKIFGENKDKTNINIQNENKTDSKDKEVELSNA